MLATNDMTRIALTLLLPLAALACAPPMISLSRGGAAPSPDGVIAVLCRFPENLSPASVWVDRTGAVYLTDPSRWRLLSFQPDGDSCLQRFELSLGNPDAFLVPGYDEGFCLADAREQSVRFYSSQGKPRGMVMVAGRTTSAAAVTAAGDLFVLDEPRREISVFDPRGRAVRQFSVAIGPAAAAGQRPAMAVTRAGDLVALTDPADGTIALHSGWGRALARFRARPAAMAFDSYSRLWTVDAEGRMDVFDCHHPGRGSTWPDGAAGTGRGSLIAIGSGDQVTVAARGNLFRCR